jgi:hypothetical protein
MASTTETSLIQQRIIRPSVAPVILALLGLSAPPLLFLAHIPTWNPLSLLQEMVVIWSGLLRCHVLVYVAFAFGGAAIIALENREHGCRIYGSKFYRAAKQNHCEILLIAILVTAFSVLLSFIQSQVQLGSPSRIWHPLLWGSHNVYRPDSIAPALQGFCLDQDPVVDPRPLCLAQESWKTLSADRLDSRNPDDVMTVLSGIRYARDVSGGIIFNVMSRDTIKEISLLRQNVEGFLPFFKDKVAVVIFENDSEDGSREAFKKWAQEASGYRVDLISCGEENPDCKFNISHRYEAAEAEDYFQSSAIGKMAEFRQIIVDHIISEEFYENFSHMVVLDMDLAVSLSPFGVLHTLGSLPDETVASSGRAVFPGSYGSIVGPYDMSAFRPIETELNKNMMRMHDAFCNILPAGDRWHNQCDAVSPMMLSMLLQHDWLFGSKPYRVLSAFNGAVMYPLKLVRSENPKYDWGDDGQRCEHISFNMGMKRPMFVNPKWNMNLAPDQPGGPVGYRALRISLRVLFLPKLSLIMTSQVLGSSFLVISCFIVLALHVFFPLVSFLFDLLRQRRDKPKLELPLLNSQNKNGELIPKCLTASPSNSFTSLSRRYHSKGIRAA